MPKTLKLRSIRKIIQYSLLTVFREGFFFEVLVEGALRCSLEFMEVEKFEEIRSAFDGHTIHKKSDYRNFEVLRDIRRNCTIYDTTRLLLLELSHLYG